MTLYFTILRIENCWNSVSSITNSCLQSHNLSLDASLRFYSDLPSPGVAPSMDWALPSLLHLHKPHLSHPWSGIRNDTAHPPCLTLFIVFPGRCLFSGGQWQKRLFGHVVNFLVTVLLGWFGKMFLPSVDPAPAACLMNRWSIETDILPDFPGIHTLPFQNSSILLLYLDCLIENLFSIG